MENTFAEKKWIGFDLDDTLHEFRRSSGLATSKSLEAISQRYGVPVSSLKESYSRILKARTTSAFSDGKTSFDYRRESSSSSMTTLIPSLKLKEGAMELLSTLKGMGKKIVVIPEGPQDAQERMVKALGIIGYIDFLATTNRFGVSKIDGLFAKVLEHLGIAASEMMYIGDSEDRDVKPTVKLGIYSIHLDESKDTSWDSNPPHVSSLKVLHNYLVTEPL
ncbi:HAD-superfamily hydrolase, subfamily IA, variant 1 [Leptodontidium sp. MPI-SDFR-AT-0119]|nr:HAD-superfamily hydrolase, subfamily IA, variant 1 [Leptodontidium sp. MPI-SDFR-AT-0119]